MVAQQAAGLDPSVAVYSARMLRVYDVLVHGISNRLLWRCPTRRLVEQYDRHVSLRHLDVGPGSGLLLDRCRFPSERPQLTLLDADRSVLTHASQRLGRYYPATVEADLRSDLPLGNLRFDSIGISYVLHCIPVSLREKVGILAGLANLLAPHGVLFGGTILAGGVRHSRRSGAVMRLYNRKQIFGNAADNLEDLEAGLSRIFPRFDLEVVGTVALFAGWSS